MSRTKVTFGAAVGVALLLGLGVVGSRPGEAQAQKQAAGWEYKAALFRGADSDGHTKQLQALAREGWEYVGPLSSRAEGNFSSATVAFRRAKK
jgi:hypothetical protein